MSDSTQGPDDAADGPDWRWGALSPVEAASSAAAADDDAEWLGWVDAAGNTTATSGDEKTADGDEGFELPADPMAPMVATMRARADGQARRRTALTRLGVGAGALVAVAAVIGAVVVALGGHDSGAAATPGPSLIPATAAAATTSTKPVWCKEVDTPTRVVSSGPGDESTAIGVIVAQQYAFYVLRDAVAVRAHMTPDAVAASPEATAAAIAALPGGTVHCVTVTAQAENQFTVTVLERHPDGAEVPWDQAVTTSVRDGRVVITAIKAGG
ncbi:hypothetical protein [Nocardia sp. NPDC004860]|uniref:hypothetical protein n=1 Tax=Nocardia sp. NPDC004860 TaxID=3154557 RepID=UPI0033BBC8B9